MARELDVRGLHCAPDPAHPPATGPYGGGRGTDRVGHRPGIGDRLQALLQYHGPRTDRTYPGRRGLHLSNPAWGGLTAASTGSVLQGDGRPHRQMVRSPLGEGSAHHSYFDSTRPSDTKMRSSRSVGIRTWKLRGAAQSAKQCISRLIRGERGRHSLRSPMKTTGRAEPRSTVLSTRVICAFAPTDRARDGRRSPGPPCRRPECRRRWRHAARGGVEQIHRTHVQDRQPAQQRITVMRTIMVLGGPGHAVMPVSRDRYSNWSSPISPR